MAGSVNKVILIGNLGADPEVKNTQDGRQIVNLRLTTSDDWRDKQTGERRSKVEWHSVVIFNEGLGKIASQYLKKGSKCYIEGQLQTRKWQDNSGNDRYTTEVVLQNYNGQLTLLDGRNEGGGRSDEDQPTTNYGGVKQRSAQSNKPAPSGGNNQKSFEKDLDDEIPF